MTNIFAWSTTAANNATADSGIGWSEGQAPSTVNNSARAMMQRVAELLADIGGTVDAGGTANALTLTANSSFTAHANGLIVGFKATADNTSSATLNVNSIGAKAIRKLGVGGDEALVGGEIQDNGVYIVIYSTDANSAAGGWLLLNPSTTVDALAGLILVPADKTYKLAVKLPFAGTITETTTISASGTCTATFKINTTALGGTANSVSSSEQSQSHSSANAFAVGDDIQVTVSSNSSCIDMSFTIKFTRSAA